MESSTPAVKEFQRSSDLLPLTSPGVSSLDTFKEREQDLRNTEKLELCGLSKEEIQLYQGEGEGMTRNKMETSVRTEKLQHIHSKLMSANAFVLNETTEDSNLITANTELQRETERNSTFYPEHHPMNSIKEIANDLFDHIKTDEIAHITKRRKVLRRMHRKQNTINNPSKGLKDSFIPTVSNNPNTLWDVKEVPKTIKQVNNPEIKNDNHDNSLKCVYGPKPQTLYTIKDKKIVRLERIAVNSEEQREQYKAVDIVLPVNKVEKALLEGTKLTLDQIKSIERFKHYNQGTPSKVLFVKNISQAANSEDVAMLFTRYENEDGAPLSIRLMSGRLRGQAFVHFKHENVAMKALEEVNGTVMKGRPIIVQFGKNSNNLQHNT